MPKSFLCLTAKKLICSVIRMWFLTLGLLQFITRECNTKHKKKKNRPIQKKASSESKLGCLFGKAIIELCLDECSMVGVFWDGEGVPA